MIAIAGLFAGAFVMLTLCVAIRLTPVADANLAPVDPPADDLMALADTLPQDDVDAEFWRIAERAR